MLECGHAQTPQCLDAAYAVQEADKEWSCGLTRKLVERAPGRQGLSRRETMQFSCLGRFKQCRDLFPEF